MPEFNMFVSWRVSEQVMIHAKDQFEAEEKILNGEHDIRACESCMEVEDTMRIDEVIQNPRMTWLDIARDEPKKLLKVMEEIGGDGWTVWLPEFFVDKLGIPDELIQQSVREIESDLSHPKSTVFDENNKPILKCTGIPSLPFHYRICTDLGINTDTELQGRGFRAQHFAKLIKEKVLRGNYSEGKPMI